VTRWAAPWLRRVPLADVRRASGYPERLHERCIDQDTHERRLAELAAAERERDEARAEADRLLAELHRLADVEDRLVAAGDRFRTEAERLRAELERVSASPTAYRDLRGNVVVDWPDGAQSCLVAREVLLAVVDERTALRTALDDTCAILDGSGAEVKRLRELLAEVLPYAVAGAHALDAWEPYGDYDDADEGAEWNRLCEGAGAMLERLRGPIRREAGLS
jgi:hypothetical protein